ncbi:hypothetical protein Q7F20_07615 [Curtobacterium sp. A7_M15]|uniref:hypothetical protein n=1 Tax=Curtobacterium sp. A7_M15 TaxID=3065241 RepID=UPI002737B2FF|nr:hypothetical protein [Curtobacterium sp. A7_M15]MDP4333236.1 hypothetical protein [Curtobacterium sp. A7_M15]
MANGDIASARGWTTYASTQQRSQGWDNDNYVLDRAAEQANRLDVVEAAVNQPIFKVGRSTVTADLDDGQIYTVVGNWFAAPTINTGFTRWNAGQLTVAKAGIYRLTAHVNFINDRDTVEVYVMQNGNYVVKQTNAGRGATGTELVRLAAGDVLAMRVLCIGAGFHNLINTNPYDMSFSAEWVRA